jgi:hypothetical protein
MPPTQSTQSLLEAVRPAEADGPLQSVVLATYGLSLEQPNFFEQDFLPALLGIGGIRDRGYTAPVNLERRLADAYCALICDAHALAEGIRPSLRIDVVPVARPRHHAKVVLIHRSRLVRLVISSANLTHAGYRIQREIAAVLDFRPAGLLSSSILADAVARWIAVLGDSATPSIRSALQASVVAAEGWTEPTTPRRPSPVRVVFGGGEKPLWQELVEAWPTNEPLLFWQVCSPFWPSAGTERSPFDLIAEGLHRRNVSMRNASIEVICLADVIGDRGRPMFPFRLLRELRERNFAVRQGRIVPARLETLEEEIPGTKAEGQRALHAKWILLRGPTSTALLLGSSNFTNSGLGVGNPRTSNIEAGILLSCPSHELVDVGWHLPLVESASVDWASCATNDLTAPLAETDEPIDWPDHIRRVELDIRWEDGADPGGALLVDFVPDRFCSFEIMVPEESGESLPIRILAVERYSPESEGHVRVEIGAAVVRRLLVRRVVRVLWGEPSRRALFPINIFETAKTGLPSILGAKPNEQQLLAYFHGRIGEDDLLLLLEQRASSTVGENPVEADKSPPVQLQNYLVREFVEGLFGLLEMLSSASSSPRALEQSLLGDFSPASLAEQIVQAFLAGRRSATATAFQLTELLRIVSSLPAVIPANTSHVDRRNIQSIVAKAILRLLSHIAKAGGQKSFHTACRDPYFGIFVRSSLPKTVADQFFSLLGKSTSDVTATAHARADSLSS